jgi:hypothetical protein
MLGCVDELAKFFIGDSVPIHPEALDCHFMRRRFLRIVLVRSHKKRAARNPDHIFKWRHTRFRLCLFSRSHGHAIAHNFFLSLISQNVATPSTEFILSVAEGLRTCFAPLSEISEFLFIARRRQARKELRKLSSV